jgi:hypothetical protein
MPKKDGMSVNIKGAAEVKLKNKVKDKVKDKVKLKGKVSKSAVQHQQMERDSTPNFLMASNLANKKEKCCEVLYYCLATSLCPCPDAHPGSHCRLKNIFNIKYFSKINI